MKNKKIFWLIIILVILISGVFLFVKINGKKDTGEIVQEISPSFGPIQTIVSTTGTVLPKNRLEIKPPVNGRIESILVKEGQNIKIGQTLAWMSSTERAALLDAARGQGKEQLKYWQEAYKPIALLAPINGEVIVATTQPGQTVTTADAVIVLSDHLIVRAQVDETDIGKVKLDQKADISLDAYSDTKIKAKVEHIYYESRTVNNVTIYEVDLIPEKVPGFFRSGMNTTINFITQDKDKALLIPLEAVQRNKEESFVLLMKSADKEPVQQIVILGITDDKNAEVISGLSVDDKIMSRTTKYILPNADMGSNPFMPFNKRKQAAR